MSSILNKEFKYVPAAKTNIRKTFARIKREMKAAEDERALQAQDTARKVAPIKARG